MLYSETQPLFREANADRQYRLKHTVCRLGPAVPVAAREGWMF